MANYKNIVPFFLRWEGGLSRNTNDSASRNPAPWPYNGVTGWHTNKGITYTTFVSMAPRMGYEISPDNFFVMPAEIWGKIMKGGYWDPYQLDAIKSQAIADFVVSFAWGSGVIGSFKQLQKFLSAKGIAVSTQPEAARALDTLASAQGEESLFLELIEFKANFLKSLNQPTFINGWLNRLEALKTFGLETIQKKKIKLTLIAAALVLLVAGSIIYYFKYYAKHNA